MSHSKEKTMNDLQKFLAYYNLTDTRDLTFMSIEKHIPLDEEYIGYFVSTSSGGLNIITNKSRLVVQEGIVMIQTLFIDARF